MKTDEYELFLNKFKALEVLIPKLPEAPSDANMKWLEDNLIEDLNLKNKLYLCRVTRNYIQHNTSYKDFVSINKGMIEFLDEMILFINSKLVNTKEVMIPLKRMPKALEEDKICSVLELMNKKKLTILPIVKDNTILRVIDIFSLNNYYIASRSKTKKIKDFMENTKGTKLGFLFLKEDVTLEEVIQVFKDSCFNPISAIFLTDTRKEKVIGMIDSEAIKKINTHII